jgi:hypothetical protein
MSFVGINSLNPFAFSSVSSYYRTSSDFIEDLPFPADLSFEPFLFGELPLPELPAYVPTAPGSPAFSLVQSFDAITLEPAAKKAKTGLEETPNCVCNFVLPTDFEVAVCDDEISETSEVTSASFYFKLEAVERRTDPDTVAESTRYLLKKRSRDSVLVRFTNPVAESVIEVPITGVTGSTNYSNNPYLPYINGPHRANC